MAAGADRRRDRAARRAGVRAHGHGAPDRGDRAGAPAPGDLRPPGRARPRARRRVADRRSHRLHGRGRHAARDLLRPVPAAAGGGGAHAGHDLRVRRRPRPADRARAAGGRAGHADRAGPAASQGQPREPRPLEGVPRLRRRLPRLHPGARHAEGVRAERRAPQAPRDARLAALPEHDVGARHQHDGSRHHRHGHRDRRRRRPRVGRVPRRRRADGALGRCS